MNDKPNDQDLVKWAEWVKDTCLLFGVSPEVAFKVAFIFIQGIKQELEDERTN